MSFRIPDCGCAYTTPVGPTLAQNCGSSSLVGFMFTLGLFLRSQCDIDDPCGRATPRFHSEPDNEYDFIVIGGGTAGSVAASRLSENKNWKVLLVEAGGDEPVGTQVPSMLTFIGSSIDWQYKTEKEKFACLNSNGVCNWPRGKVLGGTSVINGMMYIRGNPEDYDNWARLGNPGWDYKSVLPFFKLSENNLQINEVGTEYHSKGGLLQISRFPYRPPMADEILKGAQELGYNSVDLNGRNSTGFMIAQTLSRNGIRYSSARSFLRPARDRYNLHILVNTTAARVLIHPASKSVYGVEVIDNKTGLKREIRVRKEVVVSGGAINSPQILLLSGIGPREELEKPIHNLPGVGKNLMNHVSYTINYFVNEKDVNLLNWETAMNYLLFRNDAMSGTGISQVTGKIASSFAQPPGVPDIQFYFGGYLAACSENGTVGALESNGPRSVSISPTALHPKSRGYLTLASNNPLDYPRIVPNYLTEEQDIQVLIDGIRFANKLADTGPLRKLGMKLDRTPVKGCENLTFGTTKYWKCAIRRDTAPENHQAGTCKMGPTSDVNAVVDHQLRVHGVKGLRVFDTSIMPVVTSGNTMAPAIMIAEKGVAMIKEDWNNQNAINWPSVNDKDNSDSSYDNGCHHDDDNFGPGWHHRDSERYPNGGHQPNGGHHHNGERFPNGGHYSNGGNYPNFGHYHHPGRYRQFG